MLGNQAVVAEHRGQWHVLMAAVFPASAYERLQR